MALKEAFGFTLNKVSAEGAGSLYSSLATNMKGLSQVAGQNKRTALAESRAALNTFERYYNAAQATLQRSSVAQSSANAALTHSRQLLQTNVVRQYQSNIKNATDVGDAVNDLMKVGATYAASLAKADLTQGMLDGARQAESIKEVSQTDPHKAKEIVEGFLTEFQNDPASAYNRGVAQSLFPLYHQVSNQVREQDLNTNLTSYVTLVQDKKFFDGDKAKLNSFRKEYSKSHNVPLPALRDAEYYTSAVIAAQDMDKASTPIELQQATAKWEKDYKLNYDNVTFAKSKSYGTQKMITKGNSVIKNTYTRKTKEFKLQGQQMFADIMTSPGSHTYEEFQNALNYMQVNPKERFTLNKQYEKAVTEDAVRKTAFDEYTPLQPLDENLWNMMKQEDKKRIETQIGGDILEFAKKGNVDYFEKAAIAHDGHLKQAGDMINHEFVTGTPDEKYNIGSTLNYMLQTNNTAPIISRTLSDKQLTQILATYDLAMMQGAGDSSKAQQAWDSAYNTVLKASSSGYQGKQMSTLVDSSLISQIEENARDLGPNAGRYTTMMKRLYGINPDLAENNYDKIYQYFKNTVDKGLEVEGESGREYKFFNDRSQGLDLVQKKIAPDFIPEVQGRLLDYLTVKLYQKGKDIDIAGIQWLPHGRVAVLNNYGGTIDTFPVQKYLEGEQDFIENRERLKQNFTQDWGDEVSVWLPKFLEYAGSKGTELITGKEDVDKATMDQVIEELKSVITEKRGPEWFSDTQEGGR